MLVAAHRPDNKVPLYYEFSSLGNTSAFSISLALVVIEYVAPVQLIAAVVPSQHGCPGTLADSGFRIFF